MPENENDVVPGVATDGAPGVATDGAPDVERGDVAVDPTVAVDVLAQIEGLRAASREREAALRDIAAQLPAAVSRRAVLTAMVKDLRTVPDRGSVAKRVVAKVVRTPSELIARRKAD